MRRKKTKKIQVGSEEDLKRRGWRKVGTHNFPTKKEASRFARAMQRAMNKTSLVMSTTIDKTSKGYTVKLWK